MVIPNGKGLARGLTNTHWTERPLPLPYADAVALNVVKICEEGLRICMHGGDLDVTPFNSDVAMGKLIPSTWMLNMPGDRCCHPPIIGAEWLQRIQPRR